MPYNPLHLDNKQIPPCHLTPKLFLEPKKGHSYSLEGSLPVTFLNH